MRTPYGVKRTTCLDCGRPLDGSSPVYCRADVNRRQKRWRLIRGLAPGGRPYSTRAVAAVLGGTA